MDQRSVRAALARKNRITRKRSVYQASRPIVSCADFFARAARAAKMRFVFREK
jgi:hypothetical protein